MLTDQREVEQLPDGSIITWQTDANDPLSECVALVIRQPDNTIWLRHSDGRYWLTDVDELNPVPCIVLRYGRP